MDVRLLLIDPQIDFCDPDNGALYVKNAEHDCVRTAAMIKRLGKKLKKLYVTFDSHTQYQIFHQMFWMKGDGTPVDVFQQITYADVRDGVFAPVDPNMRDWCLQYTKSLDDGGRYPLIIWPYHCLIGTPGWALSPVIMEAIHDWERTTYRSFTPITKGSCYKTEHYSAVKAEVEVPEDPTTQLNNRGLIVPAEEADILLLAGQARSHCLANTVTDMMNAFADDTYIKKMHLLKDATSDVEGFEHLGEAFVTTFVEKGGVVDTTDNVLA